MSSKRTPIGKKEGSFCEIPASRLGAIAIQAAIAEAKILHGKCLAGRDRLEPCKAGCAACRYPVATNCNLPQESALLVSFSTFLHDCVFQDFPTAPTARRSTKDVLPALSRSCWQCRASCADTRTSWWQEEWKACRMCLTTCGEVICTGA